MPSFQIAIKPSRRAAGRFISHVRRTLQLALAEEQEQTGITQSDVARKIDVHRSVISRELNGRKDITLGRVAELAWALGREISFDIVKPKEENGNNESIAENTYRVLKSEIYSSASTSKFENVEPLLERPI
jgi:transcriptional regulator with XRE-family HTH domain